MFNMPPITKNLIIINAIFYFGAVVGVRWGVDLNDILGLHYFMASDFHLYQLFTYMFAHANLTHLAFNMFTLWMFGRTMERTWGPRRFLAFYIICGLGAGLTQEVAQTGSFLVAGLNHYEQVNAGGVLMSMPEFLNAWTTVGASGAIYGLLLAFGVTYSNEYIMLLIPPIPMKAKYMILLFIAFELFSGFYSGGDGVAHFAHLGGMLFGWLVLRHCRRQERKATTGFTTWEEYTPKTTQSYGERLRSWLRDKFGGNRTPGNRSRDSFHDRGDDYDFNRRRHTEQEEIDRILEKVKRSGYDSLTEEEKKRLFNASQKK